MCKYRYEFFSYCGHQTFYLFDYCDNASIESGVSRTSFTTACSDFSEQSFEQQNQSARLSGEELNLPESLNSSPSSSHSITSIQHNADTQEMSSKKLKSSKVFNDSARILETCYKVLEQSTGNEFRQQPSMEGSPGYRSISRHAFEERLRFFESAVASPSTDMSDTLSRFTYDSNTDTLYSLDLQLKRILERAQILDRTSSEKSTVAFSDISNISPRPIIAKNAEKDDGGRNKTLHGITQFSPRRNGNNTFVASKITGERTRPDMSNIASGEKIGFNGIHHDIAHEVVKSPKVMETRNIRKTLPAQWLPHGKKLSCNDLHQSFKSESNYSTKRNEGQILHSPSRREVSNIAKAHQAQKDSALSSKVDRMHAPSSPIASKAPNLRTAERAAARGLKRGQVEMTSGPSPKNSRGIMRSRGRQIKDSTSSSSKVEYGSPSSAFTLLEGNRDAKENRKSITCSSQNFERNFTFSPPSSSKSPVQSDHHRRKSSITSTSSTNPIFYSAPQSPSRPRALNSINSFSCSGGLSFDFTQSIEAAMSTDCQQKTLLTGNRGSNEPSKSYSIRGISQSQNSPRKKPRLRIQTSLIQLYSEPGDISDHSAAPLEGSQVDSAFTTKVAQSSEEPAQVEDAHEISSCTAEPASSITPDSQDSWQSFPSMKEHTESNARDQVEPSFVDDSELSPYDYGEKESSKNSTSLAANYSENGSKIKSDKERILFQPSGSDNYSNRNLSMQSSLRAEGKASHVSQRTLPRFDCEVSLKGPTIRDSIGFLLEEQKEYLFISPAIIIRPKGVDYEGEEKTVVEVQELCDVEREIKHQSSEKVEKEIEKKDNFSRGRDSKEPCNGLDVDKSVEPTIPYVHASFGSRLKATAPDFVPQYVHASKVAKNGSEAQEYTEEALKKVEPFAHQMDILSAQLQKQAIDPDYTTYNPLFSGLPLFDPFYVPFPNTYEPLSGNRRHGHKYRSKKKYKKADEERMQQYHSPVPSIGAFRDDENSAQWFSGDSTVAEQLNHNIDESSTPQMEDNNAPKAVHNKDGDIRRKVPKLSFGSVTPPRNPAARCFADKKNRWNDYSITVEPCNDIIVEKASEHVGGLPCRVCYPDFPA